MFDLTKIVGQIADLGRIPTKVVLFFGLSCATLLFLPVAWLEKVHLDKFSEDYGQWIGIVFLLSTVFFLLNVIGWAHSKWIAARGRSKLYASATEALKQLDGAEKAVLREFFIQGQNTIRMPMDEPVVAGLIGKGILRQVGSVGERAVAGVVFPFSLSEIVRDLVTPELVEIPREPSEKERDGILRARPHFTAEITHMEEMRAGLFRRRWY